MTAADTSDKFHQKYWREEPEISDETRDLFTKYVGISREDEFVEHIKKVRAKAWQELNYPCIGIFNFLEMRIQDLTLSDEVISRMKGGNETFLDLGCCFGQDIRWLTFLGAPSENMTGFDLRPEFLDLGYELYQDKSTLKSKLIAGDFFDRKCGLSEKSFDLIFASSFFHLFNWEEQVESLSKAVRLLKPKKDSLIFGRQIGAVEAAVYLHETGRSGEMYRHNEQSWKKIVAEVAHKTGTQLEGESKLSGIKDADLQKGGFRTLEFSIRMI